MRSSPWRECQEHLSSVKRRDDWMDEQKSGGGGGGSGGGGWMSVLAAVLNGLFLRAKYVICTRLMTVKWDMQQKHGSPPRVARKSDCHAGRNVMTPVHFTALSMVDISYSAVAKRATAGMQLHK